MQDFYEWSIQAGLIFGIINILTWLMPLFVLVKLWLVKKANVLSRVVMPPTLLYKRSEHHKDTTCGPSPANPFHPGSSSSVLSFVAFTPMRPRNPGLPAGPLNLGGPGTSLLISGRGKSQGVQNTYIKIVMDRCKYWWNRALLPSVISSIPVYFFYMRWPVYKAVAVAYVQVEKDLSTKWFVSVAMFLIRGWYVF